MTRLSFADAVDDWVKKTEKRMHRVFQKSAEALAHEVVKTRQRKDGTGGEGGKLPLKTGNLRRSFMASTATPPTVKNHEFGKPDDPFGPYDAAYEAVIATAQLGDTIHFGFQAAYAKAMEHGYSKSYDGEKEVHVTGAGFVASAVARWPQIVAEQTAIIRGRVEARTK